MAQLLMIVAEAVFQQLHPRLLLAEDQWSPFKVMVEPCGDWNFRFLLYQ